MIRIWLIDKRNNQRFDLGCYKFTCHIKALQAAQKKYKNLYRNLGSGNYSHEYENVAEIRKPRTRRLTDTTMELFSGED